MHKLSIVTINYNNAIGLEKTIESVVNQSYSDFEYIIIDGNSTDGSKEVILKYQGKIDHWVSEPDNGIYNAMNKGIAKATGEYLLFLNSGDHLYNDSVLEENHIFLLEKDLVYFNLNFIDKANSRIGVYPKNLLFSHFIKDTLPHPATFVKSSLFKEVGLYDESLKIVSDWKFFILALFKFNCSYMKVDTVLSTYYLDGVSSDSINSNLITDEREFVLSTFFSGFKDDYQNFLELKHIVHNLRKSRKINLLMKLRLINKF